MLTSMVKFFRLRSLGRWPLAALLLACLTTTGCMQPDVRRGAYADDDLSKMSRKLRPRDPDLEPAGLSSRARQIEADLGAR
jgi:hypothetical protein